MMKTNLVSLKRTGENFTGQSSDFLNKQKQYRHAATYGSLALQSTEELTFSELLENSFAGVSSKPAEHKQGEAAAINALRGLWA